VSDAELNRLRWRCQRGMLELDHILGGFLDGAYHDADAEVQATFADLLTLEDVEILDLIVGQAPPTTAARARLLVLLRRKGDP
jgi:antitoxin CptB